MYEVKFKGKRVINDNQNYLYDEVIDKDENLKSNASDQITSFCDDNYFRQLVESENYDEMFKNYDIDKILKYSKDKENPIGLRRK